MDPPDVELTMEHLPHILEHPAARQDETTPSWGLRRAHLTAVPQDADFPQDLAEVPTRQLRMLCNRTYQALDADRPSPSDAGTLRPPRRGAGAA
ncbi:hypothetical protein MN0502_30700 [Arthrobacter sp. MN05-02]|nr:hypothetical protein MN0502_30700 [Arthrobacter sp. MN05-02]